MGMHDSALCMGLLLIILCVNIAQLVVSLRDNATGQPAKHALYPPGFDKKAFMKATSFSKEHMAKSEDCSSGCFERVDELGLTGREAMQMHMACSRACMLEDTRPENFPDSRTAEEKEEMNAPYI